MIKLLALCLCFAVAVQGALIYAPSLTRPTSTNDVVAFILQNPTSASLSPRYITFGQPFYASQLNLNGASSVLITAYKIGATSTTVDVQVDAKALHDDGSVRQATLTLLAPAIPANSSVQFMLTRTIKKVTPLTFANLPNSVTLKLNNIAESTETFTYNPSTLVKSSSNWWLSGDLAIQARVEKWVMKAMRVVFDVTLYKDNSWCVDVIVSNDIAMGSVGGKITYDATISSSVFNKVYAGLNHYQYQGWHKYVCSAGDSKINVQFDQLQLIQARAIFPINYTIGMYDNEINNEIREMQQSYWGTPFSDNGVSRGMPGTGDRRDIGAVPLPHAAWFVSQDYNAKAYMMGWGDASHAVPWNYYLNKTGRYLNFWDYPNIWTDGRGNVVPTQLDDAGGAGWQIDLAHHPLLATIPYVISGQRYYLDLVKAIGAFTIVSMWNAARANYVEINYIPQDKGLIVHNQLRGLAWQMRDLAWAAYFTESTDAWHKSYFTKTLNDNLNFIVKNEITRFSAFQGEAYGWYAASYGGASAHPPWQDDYFTTTLSMLTLQGSSDARSIMEWARNFQVMSFFNPGWNTWNRFAYNIGIAPSNNSSAICSTYACINQWTVAIGQNRSDLTNVGGNYGVLARQTFILYQTVNRNDVDARNAQIKIETNHVQSVDINGWREDPRANPGIFSFPAIPVPPQPTLAPTPKPTLAPTPKATPKPTLAPTLTPTVKPTTAPCTQSAEGTGTGLTGEYFFTRIDPVINYNWGRNSPDASINVDNLSVKWTGRVQPRYSGPYTFYSSSDDSARLYVNNVLVIDSAAAQDLPEKSGSITLSAGVSYDIEFEYMKYGVDAAAVLQWSSPCQPKQFIPTRQLYPCRSPTNAGGNGLTAKYYSDTELKILVATQVDSEVNFDWGYGGPAALKGQVDYFSVSWTGLIQPRYSGSYTFYVSSDDGARLYVDNKLVVDAWAGRYYSESSGSINLIQGRKYTIRYEYFELSVDARVELRWSSACEAKAIIPQSQLFTA